MKLPDLLDDVADAAHPTASPRWLERLQGAFRRRWRGSGLQLLDIRWRFRIVVLAFGLPFLGYLVWNSAQEAAHEKVNVRVRMRTDATLLAARFGDHIQQIDLLLATIAQTAGTQLDDVPATTAMLQGMRGYMPKTIDNIALWALDGSSITSLDRRSVTRAVNVADRRYFRDAIARRDLAFEGPIRSRSTGTDIIQFARPVFDRDARIVAVVSMAIRTSQLIAQIDPNGLVSEASVVTVIASNGTIVTRSVEPETYSGKVIPGLAKLAEAFEKRSGDREEQGMDGTQRLAGYAVVDGFPWILMVGQPLHHVTGPIGVRLLEKMGVGLAMFALALLVAGRIAAWTTRPLMQLAADTERFRRGEMSHRSGVVGGGEIATLAANINVMAAAIAERERELAAGRAQLRSITDNIPEYITYVDAEQRYRFVNGHRGPFQQIAADDMIGRTIREVRGDAFHAMVLPHFERAMAGEAHRTELAMAIGDQTFHFHVSYVPDLDADQRAQGVYAFTQDITERKCAELLRQESEKRLVTITDNLPAMICYIDESQRFRFVNRAFERWFEQPISAIVGQPFHRLLTPELGAQIHYYFLRGMRGEPVDYELQVQSRRHGARWLKGSFVPDTDAATGETRGVYGMIHNVTKTKEAEQRLVRLAQYDSLTGLANRHQFNETLTRALEAAGSGDGSLALMFLDIDHFKQVNDRFGHGCGDLLLKEFAQRLTDCVRTTDAVARLSGDEFVVLLDGMHSDEEPQFIARKIIAAVDKPFLLDDHFVRVSTSIGIAMPGYGDEAPTALMKRADEALYEAKRAGRNTFRLAS